MHQLGIRRLSRAKPARVGIIGDNAVMKQVAVNSIEKLAKLFNLLLCQLTLPQTFVDTARNQVVLGRRAHETLPPVAGVNDEGRGTCTLIVVKLKGDGRGRHCRMPVCAVSRSVDTASYGFLLCTSIYTDLLGILSANSVPDRLQDSGGRESAARLGWGIQFAIPVSQHEGRREDLP